MMGMEPGYYRVTSEGGGESLDYLCALAKALQGTGIIMDCCIDLSMTTGDGELFTTESEAFDAGWEAAYTTASALVPLGVGIFETGNELDAKNGIRVPVQSVQGGVPEDFSNDIFPILRGVLNGCTSALRLVGGSSVQVASNGFTACSFACSDMLWHGTQPDGSTGHTPIRWDITNWHNYEDYGSMLDMSMDYEKPNTNLLDHLKAAYGKPIIVTEWNSKESNDDDQRSAWATQFMGEMYGARELFDVRALIVYQLFCGDPWGVVNFDCSIQSTFGETVRDFIAANPA
jgi:hypothetical protein